MISTPIRIASFPHGKYKVVIQVPTPNKPGTIKLNVHLRNDAILSMNQTLEYSFDIFKDKSKKGKGEESEDETTSTDGTDSFSDGDQTVPSDG